MSAPVVESRRASAPFRFESGAEEWDGFVRSQPGWTHFHLHSWKQVFERASGHECFYLASRDDSGALDGVLPLVRVRSVIFGHYLVSLPFVNYGGPLGAPEAVRRLGARAVQLARTERARLLELRSRTPLDLDLPVSHRKVTVVLDLPPGEPGRLWDQLRSKVRSQVRRPLKEGATVRFGADQVAPFFDVFSRNMRDLGTPTQSLRFFETIAECFPDAMRVGCVYVGDRPVAAGCGFAWNGEFEMTWASSLRAWQQLAPNMLLYWSFMERAADEGLRLFNFGRCTPDSGSHRFKLQWGGRDEPLWWYQRGAREAMTTPSPETNGAYALAARVWRHLPILATNRLGPRIVRYIP